jgi:hypothetical protein
LPDSKIKQNVPVEANIAYLWKYAALNTALKIRFFSFSTGDWTQGLVHAKQVFHWATHPAQELENLICFLFVIKCKYKGVSHNDDS